MRKISALVMSIILVLSIITTVSAAGYTLPEKMERQLQVGSGLKGSFVIHGNADAELNPLIHSLQNASYEIRGIQSESNQHYYVYQPGENESMNALTEYCLIDDKMYLRSDFLADGSYALPSIDQVVNSWLHAEGENPSVLTDLMRILFIQDEENTLNTESLERQLEVWISAFSTETSVQNDSGSPKLSQTFTIPLKEVYNAINDLIRTIHSNESLLSFFASQLSKDQMDTYLNPDLGYFYVNSLEQLDLDGDIRFTRTVSTLGELFSSTLVLPLDADKTGFSAAAFDSDENNKSVFLSGPRGMYYLKMPNDFTLNGDDFQNAVLYFAMIDQQNENAKNVAIKADISKKSEKYDNAEDNRIHEKVTYTFRLTRDADTLPEQMAAELIPDMAAAEGEISIHYSSKPQLSSPTTLELSAKVEQGRFNFSFEGQVKTASPWIFAPFDVSGAVAQEKYEQSYYEQLLETWMKNAEEKVSRFPEEITNEAESQDTEILTEPDEGTSSGTENDPTGDDEASTDEATFAAEQSGDDDTAADETSSAAEH